MKKLIIFPIIFGTLLLIGGGAIFAVGLAKRNKVVLKNETTTVEAFTNFDVNLLTSDFELKTSSDGTYSVEVNEYEKMPHKIEVVDGTLTIKQSNQWNWYERIFDFGFSKEYVKVYAPAGAYANFKIDNDTGDVDLPAEFSFATMNLDLNTGKANINSSATEYIKIEGNTGDVKINEVNTASLNIDIDTGDITLTKVNVTKDISLKTDTGRTTLNQTTFENMKIDVGTGDVKLINTVGTGKITIKASTSDVTFDSSDSHDLDVDTDTGDVEGTLLTGKVFDARSGTGKVKVPDNDMTTGGTCKIRTDTGKINISIKA